MRGGGGRRTGGILGNVGFILDTPCGSTFFFSPVTSHYVEGTRTIVDLEFATFSVMTNTVTKSRCHCTSSKKQNVWV